MKFTKMLSAVVIAIVVLSVCVVAYFSLPWILIAMGNFMQKDPPRPQVIHAEFPFKLEYEINGQKHIIKDSVICDYDGIGSNEGQGKYRKWKGVLASGNERVTLLKISSTKQLYYFLGDPSYYMGDLSESEEYTPIVPSAWIIEKDGASSIDSRIDPEVLLKDYKIKLTHWEYTKPIQNEFKVDP